MLLLDGVVAVVGCRHDVVGWSIGCCEQVDYCMPEWCLDNREVKLSFFCEIELHVVQRWQGRRRCVLCEVCEAGTDGWKSVHALVSTARSLDSSNAGRLMHVKSCLFLPMNPCTPPFSMVHMDRMRSVCAKQRLYSRWHSSSSVQLRPSLPRGTSVAAITMTQSASIAASPATETTALIETSLRELQERKTAWTTMPVKEKITLLEAVLSRMGDNIVEWGKASATLKGNADDALVPMEAMVTTAAPVTYMTSLLRTLRALAAGGPLPPLPTRTLANGQVAVQVFPAKDDRVALLQPGAVGELVLLPGEGQGGKGVRRAELYGGPNGTLTHEGRVCVVLGAGNQGFLALKDALFALYERGEVVAVKPHPIMKPWTPYMRHVLKPLEEAGFVRVLELETVADTQALLYHPLVECVHLTGGTATHDAIVWGDTPEEQQRRRAANDPKLKVPMSSELGCVTPVMIAPAAFTPAELLAQVRDVAVAVASNNGCNCNSHKVLVLPGDWAQAEEFLGLLRKEMREYVREPPYYPGIRQRYEAFKARYPNCEVIEPSAPGMACAPGVGPHLPFLLNIMDTLPQDPKSEPAFQVEPFAPVLTVVRLPTQGVPQFLEQAVRFANEDLWGTLSCTLVLHPDTEKHFPAETEKAICDLRYGVVGVNTWSATAVITGATTWGAFEGGQTIADVGSGIGAAGNSYLVAGVQKAVYRTPVAGLAVPMPAHRSPYSKPVVKAVCGYLLGGLWGVAKALLRSR